MGDRTLERGYGREEAGKERVTIYMPKTVSVHNGSVANREHNRRNPRTTGQMPHIQQDLVHHNETWIDIPVREAYKQIFQTPGEF